MPPKVSLKMGSFPVKFITSGVVTNVNFFRLGFFDAVFFVYAVRTLALDAAASFGVIIKFGNRYFGFNNFHGREVHVWVLGPLILLLMKMRISHALLRLKSAGGDVCRWRWMFEPKLICIIVMRIRRLIMWRKLQRWWCTFQWNVRYVVFGTARSRCHLMRNKSLMLVHPRTSSGQ